MKKSKINFTLITSIIVGFFSIMLKDKNVMNDASIIYKIICIIYSVLLLFWAGILIFNFERFYEGWGVKNITEKMNFQSYFVAAIVALIIGAGLGYLW